MKDIKKENKLPKMKDTSMKKSKFLSSKVS